MVKTSFFVIIVIILVLTAWLREPWSMLWSLLLSNEIHIPEVLNLLLNIVISAVIAFLLVLFVEWLRGSQIKINAIEPVFSPIELSDKRELNRKLLKIGIEAKANSLGKLLKLPSNVHSFATLTIHISHDQKPSFRAKWDNAPEPWEYDTHLYQELSFKGQSIKNNKRKPEDLQITGILEGEARGYPRMNLLPQALQTENLVPDDVASASILAKVTGDPGFFIYDPEYYFNKSENRCEEKKVYLKVIFKSSLGRWEEYFCATNPSSKLERFNIEKLSKDTYESNTKSC